MRKSILVLSSLVVGAALVGASVLPANAQADEAAVGAEGEAAVGAEGEAPAVEAPGSMSVQERDRRAESIARSIMSPFCPGRTVSACPNAGPWRDDIRKWVGEGVPAEEIRERLAARVPQHNLQGAPMDRYSWVIPVSLTVVGIGVLIFLLRYLVTPRRDDPLDGTGSSARAATKSDEATEPAIPKRSSEDWDARLDQELDSLEG